MIENHINSIIGYEIIKNRESIIIENKKVNKKGKVKLIKKIWIDKKDSFIHKVVYLNGKNN